MLPTLSGCIVGLIQSIILFVFLSFARLILERWYYETLLILLYAFYGYCILDSLLHFRRETRLGDAPSSNNEVPSSVIVKISFFPFSPESNISAPTISFEMNPVSSIVPQINLPAPIVDSAATDASFSSLPFELFSMIAEKASAHMSALYVLFGLLLVGRSTIRIGVGARLDICDGYAAPSTHSFYLGRSLV